MGRPVTPAVPLRRLSGQLTGRRQPDRGVSLIELLVALAILSVLALGISLTATPRGTGTDAAAFRQSHARIRDLALHSGVRQALRLEPTGLWRMQRQPDGRWRLADRVYRWQAPVGFRLSGPRAAAGQPNLIYLPNGQSTAFEIQFRDPPLRCVSDGWEGLQCTPG